jgi:hypothetical protein
MLTQEQVRNELTENLRPFLAYITQIANIFVTAGMDQGMVLMICISGAAYKVMGNPTAAAFRDALIQECLDMDEDLAQGVTGQVRAVALPGPPPVAPVVVVIPPPPVDYKAFYARDIAHIRGLRTRMATQRGIRLAAAARLMVNWFHWVKSGPREPGVSWERGRDFGPKTAWVGTRTDLGLENHPEKQNDFAGWLVNNDPQPGMASYMNCWESVLFSAHQAALVDKTWLKTIHNEAALSYQLNNRTDGGGGGQHYFLALSQAFSFFSSVPFRPQAGLIPREGDILFWERDNHVAISLGRTWVGGQPEDRIMSLWHHNGGRFAILTLDDMPDFMRGTLRFRPCPL